MRSELCADKRVDWGARRNHRHRLTLRRDERPMILPLRALFDPAAEQGDFVCRKLTGGFRRRHVLVGILRGDAVDQLALIWLAGNDRRHVAGRKRTRLGVEPESGLSLPRIRPVTLEARVGKDRTDVAVELDHLWERI